MIDSLATYEPKDSGNFLKIEGGSSAKIRVLTLDPGVVEQSGVNSSGEPWSRTQYAFIIWNWDEDKAQMWTTTPGNLNKLTLIHRSDDYEALNKTDIRVSATGEMLDKSYEIMPLPKAGELTKTMITAAQALKIEDLNGYKGRLSELSNEELPSTDGNDDLKESGYDKAKGVAEKLRDPIIEDIGDEPINLEDIPF